MDISIKEVTKKVNKISHFVELTNLVRHDSSLNNKIQKEIDIKLTAAIFNFTKITQQKTMDKD